VRTERKDRFIQVFKENETAAKWFAGLMTSLERRAPFSRGSMGYSKFIETKKFKVVETGFDADDALLPEGLFDFQKAIVKWALKKGRAAIFADTGLGKTAMQLAWANAVHQHTGNRVLIVAPLCVAQQTEREAEKFGIGNVRFVREFEKDGSTGIYVTNYEMLDHFEEGIRDGYFDGVVLDESSILKAQDGKTRAKVIQLFSSVPYRLSCTATPSPNDYMELGSQSEFLGIMSAVEMLAMFFIHDSGETSKWRLKGHGKDRFWEWLATWAVSIRKPQDLSFTAEGYDLPPLEMHEVLVETDKSLSSTLLREPAKTLSERIEARRITVDERVAKCAEIVNASSEPFIVWCHRNDEAEKLHALIPDSVEVSGSDKIKDKETKIIDFTEGRARVLITKPKIAGFGMNWQHCSQMAFVGLNDSFESLYQAIRRCYRFGQKKTVHVHMISADLEGHTLENLKRKEAQNEEMLSQMIDLMRDFTKREVRATTNERLSYQPTNALQLPEWI
jgi:SNF2 family DNA or RNA helicase